MTMSKEGLSVVLRVVLTDWKKTVCEIKIKMYQSDCVCWPCRGDSLHVTAKRGGNGACNVWTCLDSKSHHWFPIQQSNRETATNCQKIPPESPPTFTDSRQDKETSRFFNFVIYIILHYYIWGLLTLSKMSEKKPDMHNKSKKDCVHLDRSLSAQNLIIWGGYVKGWALRSLNFVWYPPLLPTHTPKQSERKINRLTHLPDTPPCWCWSRRCHWQTGRWSRGDNRGDRRSLWSPIIQTRRNKGDEMK